MPQQPIAESCWARQQQQVPEPEAQTQIQQLQMQSNGDDIIKCPIYHGADPLSLKGICTKFVKAFRRAYYEASNDDTTTIMNCVFRAKDASSMDLPTCGMIRPRSKSQYYIFCVLERRIFLSLYLYAILARFLEQCAAVKLQRTQALINWAKRCELLCSKDDHALVKFFRRRIPCSCLVVKLSELSKETRSLSSRITHACEILPTVYSMLLPGEERTSEVYYKNGCLLWPQVPFPRWSVGTKQNVLRSRCRCSVICLEKVAKFEIKQHKI